MGEEMAPRTGHLVIVSGGEDRADDMEVLAGFIKLSGGPDKKIVVATGASAILTSENQRIGQVPRYVH